MRKFNTDLNLLHTELKIVLYRSLSFIRDRKCYFDNKKERSETIA